MRSQTTNPTSRRYTQFVLLLCLLLPLIPGPGVTADSPAFQLFELRAKGVPEIRVTSKNNTGDYDTVEHPNNLRFNLSMRGQCPEDKYHLQSASITIGSHQENVPVNREHKSLGANSGQIAIPLSIFVPYFHPDFTDYYNLQNPYYKPSSNSPAELCNAEVENRVKRGLPRESVLRQGFVLSDSVLGKTYSAQFAVWCKSSRVIGYNPDRRYASAADLHVIVQCLPSLPPPRTPSQPQRTKSEPKRVPSPTPPIASVIVNADPKLTEGRQCPLYVNFRGKIFAEDDSAYKTLNTKFRFVGENGYESDLTSVSVSKGVPKSINGRRFIQTPQINSSGTFKAPGSTTKIPLYNGWMMAEVMLPNGGVRRSEKATFSVDCNPVAPARPRIKASN